MYKNLENFFSQYWSRIQLKHIHFPQCIQMSKRLWQTHHSRDTSHGHSRETSGNVKEWRLGSTWMWLCSHFWGWVAWPLQRHLCAAYGNMSHMKADWNWLCPPPPPAFLQQQRGLEEQNKSPSSLEASWEIALETNNAPSGIYICLIIIYMRPPPAAESSAGTHLSTYVCVCVCVHVCVACANNKQTAMMSLLGGSIWSAAGQKDIDCQDFATLSFRLRPTRPRRPLWCATWHCYMWPPLEVAASRPACKNNAHNALIAQRIHKKIANTMTNWPVDTFRNASRQFCQLIMPLLAAIQL